MCRYGGLRTLMACLALCIAVCLAACSDHESGQRVPVAKEAVELRVMSFNIEWGGTLISFENVLEAIRRSNADIVGIQEAEGNLQRLAYELGWHYDLRNYVISRFPLGPARCRRNVCLCRD